MASHVVEKANNNIDGASNGSRQEQKANSQPDDRVVRGRIGWDVAHDGRVPLLIIDGREITWDELGRMLMSFEGWQFKLTVADKSEEL